jgi:hypothetical protein
MNFTYLFIALFIIYIFVIRNSNFRVNKNLSYKIIGEEEVIKKTDEFEEIENFLKEKYFDSNFYFSFIKVDEKFNLHINRNYSIFFLYSEVDNEVNKIFLTFFSDGNLIITGNREFELKNIKKLSIVKEEIYNEAIMEELLDIHFKRLIVLTKKGKIPIDGKVSIFFEYIGYIIKLSDSIMNKSEKE